MRFINCTNQTVKLMNAPSAGRGNSRDSILDAAQRVTAREGAGNLTLDKVACECGLSKGGLLYNFPGKAALLQGMLERFVRVHQEKMERERASLGDCPNATLQACLRAWEPEGVVDDPSVALSILAAAAQKPELLRPLREHFSHIYERVQQESRDVTQALLLWAAVDGLLFHSLLGTAPYPDSHRAVLIQELLRMAEELP